MWLYSSAFEQVLVARNYIGSHGIIGHSWHLALRRFYLGKKEVDIHLVSRSEYLEKRYLLFCARDWEKSICWHCVRGLLGLLGLEIMVYILWQEAYRVPKEGASISLLYCIIVSVLCVQLVLGLEGDPVALVTNAKYLHKNQFESLLFIEGISLCSIFSINFHKILSGFLKYWNCKTVKWAQKWQLTKMS